jgi:hypothetical protein
VIKERRRAFDSLVVVVAWSVWLERNERCFARACNSPAAVCMETCCSSGVGPAWSIGHAYALCNPVSPLCRVVAGPPVNSPFSRDIEKKNKADAACACLTSAVARINLNKKIRRTPTNCRGEEHREGAHKLESTGK